MQCDANKITKNKFADRRIKALMVKCPNHEITAEKVIYLNESQEQHNVRNSRRDRSRNRNIENDENRDRSRSRSRDRFVMNLFILI